VTVQLIWEATDPREVGARLASLGLGPLPISIIGAGPSGDRLVVEAAESASQAPLKLAEPLVAIGWATVELDRAAANFGGGFEPAPDDELLGAFARVRGPIVILEPSTEGRLVATLVRQSEGPAAIYVGAPGGDLEAGVARAVERGARFGRGATGPLGPSALMLGGPTWGPHVILVGSATIGTP
jgi:hypothetical protein